MHYFVAKKVTNPPSTIDAWYNHICNLEDLLMPITKLYNKRNLESNTDAILSKRLKSSTKETEYSSTSMQEDCILSTLILSTITPKNLGIYWDSRKA